MISLVNRLVTKTPSFRLSCNVVGKLHFRGKQAKSSASSTGNVPRFQKLRATEIHCGGNSWPQLVPAYLTPRAPKCVSARPPQRQNQSLVSVTLNRVEVAETVTMRAPKTRFSCATLDLLILR